jgi:hypothetical protein
MTDDPANKVLANYTQAFAAAVPTVIGCFAVHFGIVAVFKALARDSTWRAKKGTHVAELVAYNGTIFLFDLMAAYVGIKAYLDGTATALSGSMHDRLYARSAAFEPLCQLTIAFECYNFLICLWITEYRQIEMLGHHLTTCTLATLSTHPFCHYYGFFYFGGSMISSAPLCLMDICTALRERLASAAWLSDTVLRPLFALLYFIIRVGAWWYVTIGYWTDCVGILLDGTAHSTPAVLFFLGANGFLSALQVLWAYKIGRRAYTTLFKIPYVKKGAPNEKKAD